MTRIIKIVLIVTLIFNTISALFGGWMLMSDPSGNSLQMPVGWLHRTPFHNLLIPGIVLFVFNGLTSLIVLIMILANNKYRLLAIFIQGFLSCSWIAVQFAIVQQFSWLQVLYGGIGLGLIFMAVGAGTMSNEQ